MKLSKTLLSVALAASAVAAAPASANTLTYQGVTFETMAVDVTDREALARVLDELPDLKGIIHAAGIVKDGTMAQLDLGAQGVAAHIEIAIAQAQALVHTHAVGDGEGRHL